MVKHPTWIAQILEILDIDLTQPIHSMSSLAWKLEDFVWPIIIPELASS